MKVQIKGLGAIKEAKINLDKPLTLFCGQNNTGKTYLAFVIYALTKNRLGRSNIRFDLVKLIEDGFLDLDIDIDYIYGYKNETLSMLKNSLDTIFGISEEISNQLFAEFEIDFEMDKAGCKEKISLLEFNETIEFSDSKFILEKKRDELRFKLSSSKDNDFQVIKKDKFFDLVLTSLVYNRISFYPITNSIIFPVERNSIYTFSKELSLSRNILIEQMQKLSQDNSLNPFDLINQSSNRYPLAIRDGLSVSNDLTNIQKKKSDFYEFALEIEKELLNGSITVNKEGEVQFASNNAKSKKLPIHLTASIVKTLSSLIIYLKHLAKKGDLIIIDEPEMNLHPDSQIILTRIFARLLNNGCRLLVSTHSDYIIREFNNLIMLSSVTNKSVLEKYNYIESEMILPADVGVHYFTYANKTKVTVKELIVDHSGFEVESIDKAINQQNEKAMDLFYSISEEV